MKVALVTYKNFFLDHGETVYASKSCSSLTRADNLLREYLQAKGVVCEPVAWDEENVELGDYDVLVIRSAWNYYHSRDIFSKFLDFIRSTGSLLNNSARIIEWNANKTYLRDLHKRGVPIIPTSYLLSVKDFTPDFLKLYYPCEEFIIKPCVSGAGRNTFRFNLESIGNGDFERLINIMMKADVGEVMVQPFIDSSIKIGETSLIFFADEFSHAVQRMPMDGDFTAPMLISSHNSIPIKTFDIAKNALLASYKILNLPLGSILYARVDLIFDHQGEPLVSELELVEPYLYLENNVDSVKKFADAIINVGRV